MDNNASFELTKIVIDPRFQVHYSSFYILGLKKICPYVKFGWLGDDCPPVNNHDDFLKGFAFMAFFSNGIIHRIFIDTADPDTIHEQIYEWADVYGKVNLNPKDVNREKIVVLGPSFAVRIWSPISTICNVFKNYYIIKQHCVKGYIPSLYEILKSFSYLIYRRMPYNKYVEIFEEDKNYIFTLNTLWYDKITDSTTNRLRGVFALFCKRLFSQFEGGFFYIDSPSIIRAFPEYSKYLSIYKEILTTKRISMSSYLSKTKKSSFVFNTPSVNGCHGWKMGEYLALGKAIISTSLLNEMPGVYEPGKQYLLANTDKEIQDCIIRLKESDDLRKQLKRASKEYYEAWLSPSAVVSRVCSHSINICS